MENYPKIFELAKYINHCYLLAVEKTPDVIISKACMPKTACLKGIKRVDFVDCYNQLNNSIKDINNLKECCCNYEQEIDIFTQKLSMICNNIEFVLASEFGANLNEQDINEA